MGEGNTKTGGHVRLGEGAGLRNWLRRGKSQGTAAMVQERLGDGVGSHRFRASDQKQLG